ncbi:MAG: hypothetical protein ACRDEB_01450, partial [Chitinophagaceae bacterium]
MMKLFFCTIVTILLILLACSKDKKDKDVVNISGFVITDNLGNQIGVIGDASDDWQIRNWSELSTKEQTFLGFPDNIDLSNTVITTLGNPIAYPNPFSNQCSIHFSSVDSVKLKIAVVDAKGIISRTIAIKMKGSQNLSFDFSDNAQF